MRKTRLLLTLLVLAVTLQGETRSAMDNRGMVYVVDAAFGVLQVDPKTAVQREYAAGFRLTLPGDLAFDGRGYLYVTDSFEAKIWRIPPGGGTPEIWFDGARFDWVFGPNGIRFDKKKNRMCFAVSLDGQGSGFVYSLPAKDAPAESELRVLRRFAPGALPEGIAVGRRGKINVVLAGSRR